MSRRVAVDIVTGFLGSGKTTLLRGLLDAVPERERIAVIVNEVGEIGIDGRVLEGFEHLESVVELAGGCICCSIDEYRFDFAIQELLRTIDPTLLIIETTGVADPGPAIERIARAGLGLDAVIAVVDATSWSRAWRTSAVARRQVEAADFLVVSKTDLVTEGQVASLRRRLARLNSRALILESVRGELPEGSPLLTAAGVRAAWRLAAGAEAGTRHGVAASAAASAAEGAAASAATSAATSAAEGAAASAAEGAGAASATHLADEGMESFAYRSAMAVDQAAFEAFLARLPREVFRAKGVVRLAGIGRTSLFNFVCGRAELSWLDAAGPAAGVQAVFVGRAIGAHRARILADLESCLRPQ